MSPSSQDSSDRDTLYVLITGANGGVGYATCTRLISNFLSSRPVSQHLHLIPTTRSLSKGEETKLQLEQYVRDLSQGSKKFFSYVRGGTAASLSNHDPRKSLSAEALSVLPSRVTITPLGIDLCSFRSIDEAAVKLSSLVPRVDVVICNAGIGGWLGLSWPGFFKQMFTEGIISTVMAPAYKICDIGAVAKKQLVIKPKKEVGGETGTEFASPEGDEPQLGEVFCANVFGHYIFVHKILNLLQRDQGSERARVIWISTLEAYERFFDLNDLQGLKSNNAYESSKRLTDLLVLNSNSLLSSDSVSTFLNDEETFSGSVKTRSRSTRSKPTKQPPEMLLCHPGICMTTIMPLLPILVWLQTLVFMFVRFVGSKWHTVSTDKGATSLVWLALEDDEVLKESKAQEKKWGSIAYRWGKEGIMETEVELMGTKEFDKKGADCWKRLEELRFEWADLLKQ